MDQQSLAQARVRTAAITSEVIDVAAVARSVEDEAAGGTAFFVGHVRNHDAGRPVSQLTYSAHPAAEEVLRSMTVAVATRFDVIAVAAVHRVGRLDVGDVAVVVAASSAHRDAAFAGGRALIEDIKAKVPIWKEQFHTDGSNTWVGI